MMLDLDRLPTFPDDTGDGAIMLHRLGKAPTFPYNLKAEVKFFTYLYWKAK